MIEYENLQKVNIRLFDEYKKEFDKFLQSGWYVLGNNVKNFENQFSKFCESQYCAGVASGLDALIIALDAFNFKKGSEVLVPSNTYIATILAIVRCGLRPVLIEPNIKTYNIDPNKIEESISHATVAIIAVHLYGKSCDMDTIVELSKKFSLLNSDSCFGYKKSILKIINDKSLKIKLSINAKKIYLKKYESQKCEKEFQNIYSRAIK